jgi:tripartite-type tricarboxylate transporter receptor subunit TctC
MALEMLKVQAGVHITHVPYKGMGQMLVDLLGGQVDIAFADPLSTMAYVKSGAVNVLGVASPQRWKSEPNIPTIAESGLPGFAVEGFNGFVAKKGTPPERIEKLNRVINDVLKMPDVIKKLGESGAEIKSGSPNDFRQLIAAEYARWGEIARKGNIRVEE